MAGSSTKTAAVMGMEVPCALLQAVAELPEESLRLGLTHLQDAEFLYEASLFPELVYTFKHALTHEVAYGSLLQERRRALHARIVEGVTPFNNALQMPDVAANLNINSDTGRAMLDGIVTQQAAAS